MPTLEASGTLTSTVTTEQTLATITSSKTLYPVIDCNNLTAGNYVIIRVKTKALSGGTTRTIYVKVYNWLAAGVCPDLDMPPLISDQEYVITLQHSTATSTAFPWKVLSP